MFDTESEIQQIIQIEARKYNCHLMRNNSGAMKGPEGGFVRFGLGHVSPNQGTASSDLIGFTIITVQPGSNLQVIPCAIFTAVECKTPGWKYTGTSREVKQKAFIDWVKSHGGLAGFAQSVDDFKRIIGR